MKRQDLHVITNALNIALILGANPSCTIHMPGGQFKAPTLSLSGEKSAGYFENIFAEKLFLATAGASLDAGLTFPAFADLYVKRAMIKAAREIILVADSTKIGRVSFAVLGPLYAGQPPHHRCRHPRRGPSRHRKDGHRDHHRPVGTRPPSGLDTATEARSAAVQRPTASASRQQRTHPCSHQIMPAAARRPGGVSTLETKRIENKTKKSLGQSVTEC